MSYFELLSNEKDYYDRLTDDERRIYSASHKQLAAINTWNDLNVREFVDVSRLLNELHRLHGRYNDMADFIYNKTTEDQQSDMSMIEEMSEQAFSMNIAIGAFSAVFRLACMDECEALYVYLSQVKMTRFNWLIDSFDIAVLIETLVSHEVY